MRYVFLLATIPIFAQTLALKRPALPEAPAGMHPVDAIVSAYWKQNGVDAPEPISDALFARRIYLDLWGLLPRPDELDRFAGDQQPDKRERLVDALLADRARYADHWITFWNDLLRNDEGVVYHGDRKTITPWLRKAIEENRPYNEFVGVLLNPQKADDPEGFLMGVNWRGDVSAAERPPMQAAQNSAQIFLGINLKCNSCHDSFVSKWKLKDAYGLASFFSDEPLEMVRCDVATGVKAAPQFLFPELGPVDSGASREDRRAAAAGLFTHPQNGRLARTYVNRLWKRLFGRGLVEPVDDMAARSWSPDLLEWLASEFVSEGYDMQKLLRLIVTSRAYQSPSVEQAPRPYQFQGPLMRRLSAEQFNDAVSTITGEWRVKQARTRGEWVREWQVKSSPLTRALGRPIRDQITTERLEEPTTLQALELVNGATFADHLNRGAKRMLGRLPPAPVSLFDSGTVNAQKVPVDVDITGARELRLLIEDSDSYDRERVIAGWTGAELVGPDGSVPLAELAASTPRRSFRIKGEEPAEALVPGVPSEIKLDIAGRGFTKFRAVAGVDESVLISEINPRVRFFVFTEEPDRHQLVKVEGGVPVERGWQANTVDDTITMTWRHALARLPDAEERAAASNFFPGELTEDGLEDLLWSLFLSPEFQYVR